MFPFCAVLLCLAVLLILSSFCLHLYSSMSYFFIYIFIMMCAGMYVYVSAVLRLLPVFCSPRCAVPVLRCCIVKRVPVLCCSLSSDMLFHCHFLLLLFTLFCSLLLRVVICCNALLSAVLYCDVAWCDLYLSRSDLFVYSYEKWPW